MKINIKATNVSITPETTTYLEKKIEMLRKFINPDDTSVFADIELAKTTNHHRSGDVFRAEINLRKDGKYFYAVAEEETLNAAIDEMKDEVSRELMTHKSKQTTLIRRGGAAIKYLVKGIGGGVGRIRGFKFRRRKK